jgi:hypothetical protein
MTSNRNVIVRSLHDLGAAAWFGGTLMGAVGVNGGSKDVKDPAERTAVAAAGWALGSFLRRGHRRAPGHDSIRAQVTN